MSKNEKYLKCLTVQKNDRMNLLPFVIPNISSGNLYILLMSGAKWYKILLMVIVCRLQLKCDGTW